MGGQISKYRLMVICNIGPIAEPEDIHLVFVQCILLENSKGITGFFGASSIERFAAEKAITLLTKDSNPSPFKRAAKYSLLAFDLPN